MFKSNYKRSKIRFWRNSGWEKKFKTHKFVLLQNSLNYISIKFLFKSKFVIILVEKDHNNSVNTLHLKMIKLSALMKKLELHICVSLELKINIYVLRYSTESYEGKQNINI